MAYDSDLKNIMLDVLENRTSSISSCIVSLTDQGYIPNRNKYNILGLVNILYQVYGIIDSFTNEQQNGFDMLYNKVLRSTGGYKPVDDEDEDDDVKYRSGPTINRPKLGLVDIGYPYFDTDLNVLIIWNGVKWVTTNGDIIL